MNIISLSFQTIILIIRKIVLEAHKPNETWMQKSKNAQTTQDKYTNKLGWYNLEPKIYIKMWSISL